MSRPDRSRRQGYGIHRAIAVFGAVATMTVAACGASPAPSPTPVTDTANATSRPTSEPTFDPTPAPEYTRPPAPTNQPLAIEAAPNRSENVVPHRRLTSSRFGIPVSFWVDGFGGRDDESVSDWCEARTSARSIVLPYKMGCVTDLRILHPSAVICGMTNHHPDADAFAERLLAIPGLHAVDRGVIGSSDVVPDGFFAGRPAGRVVDVLGAGHIDPDATDPDHCVIKAGDPTIEVRGDIPARFIAMDIDGELVILRYAAGYDRTSAAAASDRGYLPSGISGAGSLGTIHDLTFGP